MIRWLAALALFGLALGIRFSVGILYGAIPALAFYPMILIVSVLFGWMEAVAVLGLSAIAGLFLFLPPGLRLQPIGWLLVGGMTIAIIDALKALAVGMAEANERQRLLFQELQHRVANTLQATVGRLDIVRRRMTSNPTDAGRMLDESIRHMILSANVHRRLNDPTLFEQGLESILRDAVATAIDAHSTNIGFEIEPIQLSFDQMSVITMLVIEIANNTQRHAFERNLGWHFLVSLRPLPDDLRISLKILPGGRAELSVKAKGPGLSQTNGGETGQNLDQTILRGLVDQLGGHLRVEGENASAVSVVFPIRSQSQPVATVREPGLVADYVTTAP